MAKRKLPEIDPFGYLPLRYEDRRMYAAVWQFRKGEKVLFRGYPEKIGEEETWTGRKMLVVSMTGFGGIFVVKYYHYTEWHLRRFQKCGYVSMWGAPKKEKGVWTFYQPSFPDEIGRICPVYKTPSGIGQRRFRNHVWGIARKEMSTIEDEVSTEVLARRGFPTIREALQCIHRPHEIPDSQPFLRLAYREVFELKKRIAGVERPAAPVIEADILPFIESLPFDLTEDQVKAVEEILRDMSTGIAMRRILVGDVSSGKTVVSQAAAYACMSCGYRTLVLTPSTVLARQHYEKFSQLFGEKNVGLCTGREKTGDARIIIGTHALLNRKFKDVGLVVIDEQHRFGVSQRTQIALGAHALQLTATPIPRTVSLIYQGAIDISTLHSLPFKRDVMTRVVSKSHSTEILSHIREVIGQGGKALVVYPLVDDEKGEYKSVESSREYWEKAFPGETLFVHGKTEGKEEIVSEFRTSTEKRILVATSLIETGIDIPEASILVVSGAECFGLAALHQLRGRIGRRGNRSFCYFMFKNPEAQERLRLLETVNNGFELAERDTDSRGWGDTFGRDQSGNMFKLPGVSIYKKVIDMVMEDLRSESAASNISTGGDEENVQQSHPDRKSHEGPRSPLHTPGDARVQLQDRRYHETQERRRVQG
jgi:ATP-dependent DNA helicase RecG